MNEKNIKPDIVYSNTMDSSQIISSIKIVLFYVFELIFWLIISKLYANYGTMWIVPSISVMWIAGAVTAWFIREEKENTAKETKWTILGFLAFLFLYRGVIQLISPITSEQMTAALNITIPAASGLAAAGLLQNILLIVSVMTPIGFVVWCGQKFRMYQGRVTKQEAFQKIKGTRNQARRY